MSDRLTFDDDGTLDELVMTNATIHLEHLGDGEYMLIAQNTADHVHLNLTVRRRGGIPAVRLYERFTPTSEEETLSTYWYLECTDHEPVLRSADEVEQHTHGLPAIRHMVRNRAKIIETLDWEFEATDYFKRNTIRFLVQHPKCNLRFASEYGEIKRAPQQSQEPISGPNPTDTKEETGP